MNAFGNMLVCGLIQVTLVAGIGLVMVVVSGRWSRTASTAPAALALCAIIALTLIGLSSRPSWFNQSRSQPLAAGVDDSSDASDLPTGALHNSVVSEESQSPPSGLTESLAAGFEAFRKMNQQDLTVEQSREPTASAVGHRTPVSWRIWFSWLFAGGIVCGLIRLIGGLWGVQHFVRSSRPIRSSVLQHQVNSICAELSFQKQIELRECPKLATAATVGWRHPVILISAEWKSWNKEQLRSVLAHEIAHISRGDFAASVAAQLGLVLHFYHPLVHWLVNRLRLEQELAADAIAAKVVGGSRMYLRAIGELALTQSKEHVSWPAHTFLPTRRTFLRRIEMLRDLKLLSGPAPLALRVSSIVAIAAITLFAVGLRPPNDGLSQSVAAGQNAATQTVIAQNAVGKAATATAAVNSQSVDRLDARYVPANAFAVAVFRPKELAARYFKAKETTGKPGLTVSEEENLEVFSKCNLAVVVMMQSEQGVPDSLAVALMFDETKARDVASRLLARLPQKYRIPSQHENYLPCF